MASSQQANCQQPTSRLWCMSCSVGPTLCASQVRCCFLFIRVVFDCQRNFDILPSSDRPYSPLGWILCTSHSKFRLSGCSLRCIIRCLIVAKYHSTNAVKDSRYEYPSMSEDVVECISGEVTVPGWEVGWPGTFSSKLGWEFREYS